MGRGRRLPFVAAAFVIVLARPAASFAQSPAGLYRVDVENVASVYDADLTRMLPAHVYAYLEPGTLDVFVARPPEGIRQRERITFIGNQLSAGLPRAASEYLMSQLLGRDVLLAFDSVMRDGSGRLLCYVYLPDDGTCVNLRMIRDGFTSVDRDSFPFHFLQEFSMDEQQAREKKRGIWAH